MAEQIDLFLDSMVDRPWRNDRALLEFPFFSLQKTPRFDPIIYDDGRVSIEVSPGRKGMATIWDKDILIYLTSLLNERIERGAETSRTVIFSARDCLQSIGRDDGGGTYEAFKDALFRLRSTTITTTIKSAGEEEERGFGWIDSWKVVRKGREGEAKQRMGAIEVVLADWMYRAIVSERRVLSIDQDYFRLTMGIERRVYELVRKHLGHQAQWVISLPRLAEKIGTTGELRNLKADLAKIIKRDSLPSYTMSLEAPAGSRNSAKINVVFGQRKKSTRSKTAL